MTRSAARPDPAETDAAARRVVAPLRVLGRTCRARARLEPFEACALLAAEREATVQPFAEALLRALAQALGRAPGLLRPGARELSADERWLAALLQAAERGDDASLAFLTATRLPRHHARQIVWLARRLAERLAEPDRGGQI